MSQQVPQHPSSSTPSSKCTNVVQNGNQNAIPLKQSPTSTLHNQTTTLPQTPTSQILQEKKLIGQSFAGQNENSKGQNTIFKPLEQSGAQPNTISKLNLSNGNENGKASSNLSSPNQVQQGKIVTQQVQVISSAQKLSPTSAMVSNLQNRPSIPGESNAMKRKLEMQTSKEDQQFKRFNTLNDLSESPHIVSSASSMSSEEVPLASLSPLKKVVAEKSRSPLTLYDSMKEGFLIKDEKIKALTSNVETLKDLARKFRQNNATLEENARKEDELKKKNIQEIAELQKRCKEYEEIVENCFNFLKANGVNI